MNRLSLSLAVVVVLGLSVGVMRGGDTPPETKAITPLPQADPFMISQGQNCGVYCQPDCSASCRNGLVGGVGIYCICPYFENNPAFTVSTTSPTGPGGTSRTVTERTDIRQHMEVAPQLWLGYVSDSGLGGRVRWWCFRQTTDQGITVAAAAPNTVTFLESAAPLGFPAFVDNEDRPASISVSSKLQLQVWDAEAMSSVRTGDWDLLIAGGLRFAHINQQYNSAVAGDSGGGTGPITANVPSSRTFNGIGPVIALEVRRYLGDSGLSLYGSARGAVLFGTAKQNATDNFFSSEFGDFSDSSSYEHDSALPVAELELGMEFGRKIGSTFAFGQVALVGQEWWGAGNASRSVNTNTFGVPNTGGAIVDSNLSFLGVTLRLGVDY